MMDDREKGVSVCLGIWNCDMIIVWCRIYVLKRKETEIISTFQNLHWELDEIEILSHVV